MTQTKIEGKFYPLTPEVARKLREAKLTAAEWRLWSYLVELDPFGDRYIELPDMITIMQECDMKKSTFYAAIAKFQALELFDFQYQSILARNLAIPKNRKVVQEIGKPSENSESFPKNRKVVQEIGKPSENSENQKPEPLPEEDSNSRQTIQTYSDFKKTLSEGERENFKSFCQRRAGQYDKPVVLLDKWIEKNFFELYEEYQRVYKKDKFSAAPVVHQKTNKIHPAIAQGLSEGRITKLDPHYNPPSLWTDEGYWMSQSEWIEKYGSGDKNSWEIE